MNEPLSLAEGARRCVLCGFCCKQASCGAAPYDKALGRCEVLLDNGDGTYSCGKYEEILAMPRHMWEMSPAFGAGCCSSINEDRKRIVRRIINGQSHLQRQR